MENFGIPQFCSTCETRLKRQVIGSNVFYYCQSCGRVSSEACFSGRVDVLRSRNHYLPAGYLPPLV